MSRQNPYTVMKTRFSEWVTKAINRRRIHMWLYPKDQLQKSWKLDDLWERVAAADQLGYEVVLVAKDDGLHVKYVEKLPARPWDI